MARHSAYQPSLDLARLKAVATPISWIAKVRRTRTKAQTRWERKQPAATAEQQEHLQKEGGNNLEDVRAPGWIVGVVDQENLEQLRLGLIPVGPLSQWGGVGDRALLQLQ